MGEERAWIEEQTGQEILEIISGGAKGVDQLGEKYAKENGLTLTQCIPDWDKYGKSAGFRRNEEMAERAQGLIAIWDGKSNGTKHMIEVATKKGLHLVVHKV